jgi:hypothetical protein
MNRIRVRRRGPERTFRKAPGHDGPGLPVPMAGCPDGIRAVTMAPPRAGAHGTRPAHQRAAPPTAAGPPRWVPSLGGYRLSAAICLPGPERSGAVTDRCYRRFAPRAAAYKVALKAG